MSANLPPEPPSFNGPTPQFLHSLRAITRPRPAVPMLEGTKIRLFMDWFRGVPEKDLSKMYELRREEVELVLHEVASRLLLPDRIGASKWWLN